MRLADRLRRTLDEGTSAPSEPPLVTPAPSLAPPDTLPLAARLSALSRSLSSARPRPGSRPDGLDAHAPLLDTAGPPPPLDEALPGLAMSSRSAGSTWVATTRHPCEHLHGAVPLAPAGPTFDHLELVTGDLRLHGFDPRQALYLDIEATGLEQGAGTLAFMIGLGHFDGDEVVVTQLVLREPDEEKAQLELLWDLLDAFPFLVSFNGKSFDLSVLQSRLVMNRLCSARESELKLRPHLDLLHLGKNLYRGALTDTRLQTLERHLLGFCRKDDMPGALAPSCWFHWLREGDPRPLAAIAEHNRFDVLSMVALAHHFATSSLPVGDSARPSALWLNLARTYARRRRPYEALAVLASPPPLLDPDQRIAALELEATLSRRVEDDHRTCRALQTLIGFALPDAPTHQRALTRAQRRLARREAAPPRQVAPRPLG